MDTQGIWICEGSFNENVHDYSALLNILEPHEQQHVSLISNPKVRSLYIQIHAQLRKMLAGLIKCNPEQLRILKTEYGKPYLADYPDLAFNLSHTTNKFLIVIGYHQELGVDMETCKPRKTLAALVDKCFAKEEQDYWRQLPEHKQIDTFYRFWVRKEAFVKAVGRGIALGLNRCVINPDKHNEFLRIPFEYGRAEDWHIQEIDVDKPYCAAYVFSLKTALPK